MGLIKKFKVGAHPVIDGIVAKGRDTYAISLKKTSGNILLDKGNFNFISRAPLIFLRGIIAFIENCMLIIKMLGYSADYFDKEEKSASDIEFLSKEEMLNRQDRLKAEQSQNWLVFVMLLFFIALMIVAFFLLPVFISSLFFDNVNEGSWIWFNVIEGCSRIIIFIMGLAIFKGLGGACKKLRQYQAAGNKAVNCFERGIDLAFGYVKVSSKLHPRSGDFIVFLTVVIASIALMFFKIEGLISGLLIRLLVLVLSINIAYEISRLFGMFNGKVSRAIAMILGMWVEFFTTDEPDDMQIYIAIAAVQNSMTEGV